MSSVDALVRQFSLHSRWFFISVSAAVSFGFVG